MESEVLIDKASDHFTYINQLLIVKTYLQVRNKGLRHLEFFHHFFFISFDILFITCIRLIFSVLYALFGFIKLT